MRKTDVHKKGSINCERGAKSKNRSNMRTGEAASRTTATAVAAAAAAIAAMVAAISV